VNLTNYFPGQRWVSQTEAELGLGIIVECSGRHLTVSFPAAAERRLYAEKDAPLTRVIYNEGDTVNTIEHQAVTITSAVEQHNCIMYTAINAEGEALEFSELELDSFIHFSKPEDRLFAGQIDKLRDFRLRYQSRLITHHLQQSPVQGLFGPRIDLLPHQLYIAHSVANRYAPRVLLADEVGLGKTIEAGLIIHQQLVKGMAKRVLVAVPEALQHQWLVEMLRRFNLAFTLLDEERCQALAESEHENPFEAQQWVICPLTLFTDHPDRLQQALATDWDLLIVDEAHHLQWQEDNASEAYSAIESLAAKALGLIMLTATPEQLGVESHFARLRLLDPDRYYDLTAFRAEQQSYQALNKLVQSLLQQNPDDNDLKLLTKLTDQATTTSWQKDTDALVKQLLDHHGTGRVLYRNTRSSVKGFPQRILHTWPLEQPEAYELRDITASIEECLKPEKLLGESWVDTDPRVAWLQKWLKDNRQEKALVICADAESALDLEFHLRLRGGARTGAFHQGMNLLERDRAAAYFADDIDGAQVLICSEIGSEGRNFQFAHHLVLFDLPLNPDLLEQRIGRLDRIGQQEAVNIHVPFYVGSPQESLLDWYHLGINAFEQVCPIGQTIFDQFSMELEQLLENADPSQGEALIKKTRESADSLRLELQTGRDRLLELNSCDTNEAQQLIGCLEEGIQGFSVNDYMSHVFDVYGVDHERHSDAAIVVRPSDHMQTDYFPQLPEEGLTATYERQQALSREDMHYLTWEHPMVSGCMDMILGSEKGNTALCTLKLPPLKPGTLLVEAIYQLHSPAPQSLQIQRHFGGGCIRLLRDNQSRDLGHVIGFDHINQRAEKVKLKIGQQIVRQARASIQEVLNQLHPGAETQLKDQIKQAQQHMEAESQREIQRLQQLARVNPNIRQEEIDHLQSIQSMKADYIDQTQISLDAVRVIITV